MREEEIETAIKVVIVGNGAVGKSSMIQRYCRGMFTKEYKKTIGVDFLERQIEVNGEDVRLMLWDTAGQEEFDAITKAYYRGAQACVLTFSTVDRMSFLDIHSWKMKVEDECGEIPMVLVQNKIDLIDQATVTPEEAETLAKKMRLRFYRTSVKEDLNVNEVFRYLCEKYLLQMNNLLDSNGMEAKSVGPNIFTAQINPTKGSGKKANKRHSGGGTITLQPNKSRPHGSKKIVFKTCTIL